MVPSPNLSPKRSSRWPAEGGVRGAQTSVGMSNRSKNGYVMWTGAGNDSVRSKEPERLYM